MTENTISSDKQQTEFKINHNHNYYACPVARPGCQLFIARLEWEAELDETDEEAYTVKDTTEAEAEASAEADDDDERDFTLSMINFSGIQFIVVSLDRNVHHKVIKIADELDLKVVPGYPLARIGNTNKNLSTNHFPIRCAADSIFTIEGNMDINDPHELMKLKQKESKQVQEYLLAQYKVFEQNNMADNTNTDEILLINSPEYKQPARKVG
jgi:hypothetical protein